MNQKTRRKTRKSNLGSRDKQSHVILRATRSDIWCVYPAKPWQESQAADKDADLNARFISSSHVLRVNASSETLDGPCSTFPDPCRDVSLTGSPL